ncbi:hypothetical protein A2881_00930 [Candidatus Peribacteria bacterium RIFCSPHIGHO2_01_FULL_55_13]|nr:MAG: hypothetical protein A2881_00930 [Candidatus Peribacteria bacterium RIFCSPHIGHO2_01_FULL_55_13]OGJ65419.1 MAG: hypothetical protein A3F36_04885 [Candidatus Peribacteria bacterium RIFCSPHIGHO2_12_FULL_55_11]
MRTDGSGGEILRILTIMFLILLCLISLLCLYLELRISILHPSNDAYILQAVGRGILNGLMPYQEIFDPKPPGIFLLNTISLFLFGDRTLMTILIYALSIVFVVIALIASWHHAHRLPFWQFIFILSGGLLVGMILAIWHAKRAYWPDFHATIFCLFYALSLVIPMPQKTRIFLGGICIFLVAFLREPLILVFLSIGLLFTAPSWQSFTTTLILPGSIGLVLWIAVMWLLGYLGPYLDIYLPTIMIRRGSEQFIVWGLALEEMILSLWYISPFFVPAIGGMTTVVLLHSHKPKISRTWKLLMGHWLRFFIALLMTMIAVYPFDIGPAYTGFAIPFYSAISFLWLRELRIAILQKRLWVIQISYGIVGALALTVVTYPLLHQTELKEINRTNETLPVQEKIAMELDAILDECGQERYMYFGPMDQFFTGLTRHSPYGPAFFLGVNLIRKDFHGRGILENARRTNIALVWKNGIVIEKDAEPYILDATAELRQNFQIKPWSCMRHDFTDDLYVLLFRKIPI